MSFQLPISFIGVEMLNVSRQFLLDPYANCAECGAINCPQTDPRCSSPSSGKIRLLAIFSALQKFCLHISELEEAGRIGVPAISIDLPTFENFHAILQSIRDNLYPPFNDHDINILCSMLRLSSFLDHLTNQEGRGVFGIDPLMDPILSALKIREQTSNILYEPRILLKQQRGLGTLHWDMEQLHFSFYRASRVHHALLQGVPNGYDHHHGQSMRILEEWLYIFEEYSPGRTNLFNRTKLIGRGATLSGLLSAARQIQVTDKFLESHAFAGKLAAFDDTDAMKRRSQYFWALSNFVRNIPSNMYLWVSPSRPFCFRGVVLGDIGSNQEGWVFTFDVLFHPTDPRAHPDIIVSIPGATDPHLFSSATTVLSPTWLTPGISNFTVSDIMGTVQRIINNHPQLSLNNVSQCESFLRSIEYWDTPSVADSAASDFVVVFWKSNGKRMLENIKARIALLGDLPLDDSNVVFGDRVATIRHPTCSLFLEQFLGIVVARGEKLSRNDVEEIFKSEESVNLHYKIV
ncbi:hypothetical protein BJ875DRAFT_486794 [Amylocarpus encephaloides]|uniref:Uncharacterized protein n=1 Tax=Amylocarpus encephaloides TaxID=45428 RepID=A0A9P8C2Q1_9HELO|nr:hypothetical protein BJ875DRAFT_486794 [Amylocarpus encephaloides]